MLASPGAGRSQASAAEVPAKAEESKEVFDLKDVDKEPVATFQQRPRYPENPALLRGDWQCRGAICSRCEREGMGDARVVEATHPEFGAAAVKAISGNKYKPAMKNGRPVNVRMQSPHHFRIPMTRAGAGALPPRLGLVRKVAEDHGPVR